MTKRTYTLLAISMIASIVSGSVRTAGDAESLARTFFNTIQSIPFQGQKRVGSSQTLTLAYTLNTTTTTAEPALYVFALGEEGGWVVVSAEDQGREILGYGNSVFDSEDIPSGMSDLLHVYASDIKDIRSNSTTARTSIYKAPSAIEERQQETSYTNINPLLTSVWGQSAPYYNLCPKSGGSTCVTGCVATAAAQVMYYHKHPAQGIGSHSYKWGRGEGDTIELSVDFSSSQYDWANMKDNYKTSYSKVQGDAVAKLMYDAGVSCDMLYRPSSKGGSSATLRTMVKSLTEYFGYDEGICPTPRNYMSEEEILDEIYTELSSSRPVLVRAQTPANEGHAFVCDGIRSDGYLHINWGWSGTSDGYFALSAFNPKKQGTGGSANNYAFTESIIFYTGIKPSADNAKHYRMLAESVEMTTANHISKKTTVKFNINKLQNTSLYSWTGKTCALIYQNGTQRYSATGTKSYTLSSGTYYTTARTFSANLSSLPEGEYEISMGCTITEQDNAKIPVYCKGIGEYKIPFVVTADSIFFNETLPEEEPAEFTSAIVIYYPDTCNATDAHYWLFDISTSEFWTSSTSKKDSLIRLYAISQDAYSPAGTYIVSNSKSRKSGTISGAESMLAHGNSSACYTSNISAGALTLTSKSTGDYTFTYNLTTSDDKNISGKINIPAEQVDIRYTSGGKQYIYSSADNARPTCYNVTEAVNIANGLGSDGKTIIPYLIKGTISSISTSSSTMAKLGYGTYTISDNSNSINCMNNHWLDDEAFTTGAEISVNDTVVVCAPIRRNGKQGQLYYGYIYLHKKGQDIPQSIEEAAKECDTYRKAIENGTIYILCGKDKYDLTGQKVQ